MGEDPFQAVPIGCFKSGDPPPQLVPLPPQANLTGTSTPGTAKETIHQVMQNTPSLRRGYVSATDGPGPSQKQGNKPASKAEVTEPQGNLQNISAKDPEHSLRPPVPTGISGLSTPLQRCPSPAGLQTQPQGEERAVQWQPLWVSQDLPVPQGPGRSKKYPLLWL